MPTSESTVTATTTEAPAARPRFEFKREGDWYLCLFHDRGLGVAFEMLRESGGELHGDITVHKLNPEGARGTHLHWAKLNLSSTQARETLAKKLEKDERVQVPLEAWRHIIEAACLTTAREYRKGEPILMLDDGEARLEVDYLVSPLIAAGHPTAIFADGDSGKGWIALLIALSLRLGDILPGIVTPTRLAKTLYLDWETDYDENRRRLDLLCRGLGLSGRSDGIGYRRMFRPLADDISTIRAAIAREQYELVVIDSAALATGGDLRDSEHVIRFMSALGQLRPAASLVLGHVSKATADATGGNRGRMIGSVFYENLCRSVWEVRSDSGGNPITMGFFHRKANMGRKQKPFGLSLRFDDGRHLARFEATDIADVDKVAEHAPLSWRLEEALKRGAMHSDELAERLNVTESMIRTEVTRSKGRIIRLNPDAKGRGSKALYGLTAPG